MLQLASKRNTILLSLESARAELFETFGGVYPSPQLTRLAQQGIVFRCMISPSASTGMCLARCVWVRRAAAIPRQDFTTSIHALALA